MYVRDGTKAKGKRGNICYTQYCIHLCLLLKLLLTGNNFRCGHTSHLNTRTGLAISVQSRMSRGCSSTLVPLNLAPQCKVQGFDFRQGRTIFYTACTWRAWRDTYLPSSLYFRFLESNTRHSIYFLMFSLHFRLRNAYYCFPLFLFLF